MRNLITVWAICSALYFPGNTKATPPVVTEVEQTTSSQVDDCFRNASATYKLINCKNNGPKDERDAFIKEESGLLLQSVIDDWLFDREITEEEFEIMQRGIMKVMDEYLQENGNLDWWKHLELLEKVGTATYGLPQYIYDQDNPEK